MQIWYNETKPAGAAGMWKQTVERRLPMKIAVVTDSGTGWTMEQARALGLYYLPLQVKCGDEEFLDGVDLTVSELYARLKRGEMPTRPGAPSQVRPDASLRPAAEGLKDVELMPKTDTSASPALETTLPLKPAEKPLTHPIN